MKKWSKAMGLILACAALLCGCAQEQDEQPPAPPPTALELYTAARALPDNGQHLIVEYDIQESRTVQGNRYTKEISGTASYSDINLPTMTAVVEEKLRYGNYENRYMEVYCEGAAYIQAAGRDYSVSMTPEAFVAQQLPGVLVDATLYAQITSQERDSKTVISFENPTAPESWLAKDRSITLTSATATATLDSTGVLNQYTYQAEYVWEGVSYSVNVTTRISVPKTLDLTGKHPEHVEGYVALNDLRIPKLLMQVVGDVYSAKTISYTAAENIYSEVLPLSMIQTHQLLTKGAGDDLYVKIDYQTVIKDYRGDESMSTQTDLYQNKAYSIVVNGGETQLQPYVAPDSMRQACEDAALSALMAMKYLSAGTVTDQGDTLRVDLWGNESFEADLMVGITDFLQVDLDARAEAKETVAAGGYLVIDKYSGLPSSMGLALERAHKLTGVVYQLKYSLDQTLSFVETE